MKSIGLTSCDGGCDPFFLQGGVKGVFKTRVSSRLKDRQNSLVSVGDQRTGRTVLDSSSENTVKMIDLVCNRLRQFDDTEVGECGREDQV